ncbi:MAG: hypothetical protein CMI30_07820 [Opitutae bacterium]|nr:hypothetical protein [Opitutae bacterium]
MRIILGKFWEIGIIAFHRLPQMNQKIVILAFILGGASLGMFLGFYMGKESGFSEGEGHYASTAGKGDTKEVPGGDNEKKPSKGDGENYSRTDSTKGETSSRRTPRDKGDPSSFRPKIDPPADLVQAMTSPDLINRWGAFLDAVRTLDENNVEQVVAAFETLPSGYERNMEMRLLMQAWAEFDPKAALSYAQALENSESRLAITEAMTAWGKNSPDAALAWINENLEETEANRQGYLPGVISGIASHDLDRANELLLSLEDRNARWQASNLLAQRYLEKGIEEAMTWASSLPNDDPNFRNGLLGQVGAAVAKRDPESCSKWVKSLEPGEGCNRVVSALVAQWSRKSPPDAAKWAGSLEDSATRVHGMTQVVNYWAFKDPAATAKWLNDYPRTEETDPVLQTFVNRVTSREPQTAADWANAIMDNNRRDASVRQVLRNWSRLNVTAAEAWRVANAPHLPVAGGEVKGFPQP